VPVKGGVIERIGDDESDGGATAAPDEQPVPTSG
jgi:hypothetical protein